MLAATGFCFREYARTSSPDWRQAILVGRILTREGPTPVVVVAGRVRDVSRHAATVSQLLNGWNGDIPPGADLGPLESFGFTRQFAEPQEVRLLSPVRPAMREGQRRHLRDLGHGARDRGALPRRRQQGGGAARQPA
jgi:hypothetical protein